MHALPLGEQLDAPAQLLNKLMVPQYLLGGNFCSPRTVCKIRGGVANMARGADRLEYLDLNLACFSFREFHIMVTLAILDMVVDFFFAPHILRPNTFHPGYIYRRRW